MYSRSQLILTHIIYMHTVDRRNQFTLYEPYINIFIIANATEFFQWKSLMLLQEKSCMQIHLKHNMLCVCKTYNSICSREYICGLCERAYKRWDWRQREMKLPRNSVWNEHCPLCIHVIHVYDRPMDRSIDLSIH